MSAMQKQLTRQILWNRLIAVVEEQANVLLKTAFGPITREAGDLSAGVYDTRGRMLAQAVTGTPGHVNSMAESVKHFLAAYPLHTLHDGDVLVTNDPWKGTGHLNDFTMVTPVFRAKRVVALFASTLHVVERIGKTQFLHRHVPLGDEIFGAPEDSHATFTKCFEEEVAVVNQATGSDCAGHVNRA